MKSNVFVCVDLKTQMKQDNLQVLDARKGTLFRNEEDKFTFTEKGANPNTIKPWKRWKLIERSLHGKVLANDTHIKVEFYIHHEDYVDGKNLADMLAYQIEQLGETLCDTDLDRLVESIRDLKKEAKCC